MMLMWEILAKKEILETKFMAAYFPTSNSQSDPATMLYSRDTLPGSYSETPVIPGNTMMYMNFSPSSGPFSNALAGNSQRQSTCFEIQPAGNSEPGSSQQEIMLNFGGSRIVEHDLSSWKDGRNEMLMMQPMNGAPSVLQGQGLSLSLGTHIPSGMQISPIPYQNDTSSFSPFLGPNPSISNDERGGNQSFEEDDNSRTRQLSYNEYMLSCIQGTSADAIKTDSYGMSSMTRAIPSSKYLKAAQQLLDEVVNVKKAIKEQNSKKELVNDSKEADRGLGDGVSDPSQAGVSSAPPGSTSNSTSELPAAEKQDLQNRLTKLLAMLDEVDRRYKQYYHQMKIVVSSFDVIAGSGAAKPYTALALLTISRHFRCLRDAINDQIQVARKNLGEQDDSSNGKGIVISRLRYVDKQLRQQRALQQLGMMPQHAWRPQRGLPETSVSILRAWLFEHFLHPYPKDSDKIMLARQTGLTRSQVSNWFINARVRLWKPMVEEMYKEETGDTEVDSNSSSETTPRTAKTDSKTSQDKGEDFQQTSASSSQHLASNSIPLPDIEMMEPGNSPTFQPPSKYCTRKSGDEQRQIDETTLFHDSMGLPNYGTDRYIEAAYHISEFERFGNGSGKISLTLGLQQSAGGSIPICNETRNGFVNIRGSDAYNAPDLAMETETAEFDCMDPENRQQRFVPTRLLHDFVA
ncbi:BEL1-like homeodomain protein 7 isoform X1 [Henckelia pumila]|uniref:BEL1-like homeodomain protein 7 isoform X1 n=2 Tax=Henckelia pumila TaxID=405737 RepID=UPI003C6E4E01